MENIQSKKKLARVLHYFPLITRLKLMYASLKTTLSIRWHDKSQTKDKMLRHPAKDGIWRHLADSWHGKHLMISILILP